MKVVKDYLSIDEVVECTECREYQFEGNSVYIVDMKSSQNDIKLCENCVSNLYSHLNDALDFHMF